MYQMHHIGQLVRPSVESLRVSCHLWRPKSQTLVLWALLAFAKPPVALEPWQSKGSRAEGHGTLTPLFGSF
jgi:hypothetical protein